MELTDRELVERFRRGDQDAATDLYNRYVDKMLGIVRSRLAGAANRGVFDSEGMVAAGFRSLFSAVKKPAFDTANSNIGGLLRTMVECKCFVELRKKPRPMGRSPEDLQLIVEHMLKASENADSVQEITVQLQELIDDIRKDLTEQEQKIVALFLDWDNPRSREEIASECQCSLAVVKATLQRFEDELIRRLKDLDDGEQSTGMRASK